MALALPMALGGRVYFRLSHVDIEKRRKAGERIAAKLAVDPGGITGLIEAAEIRGAAEHPNGRVFSVTVSAWSKVMGAPP